MEAYYSMMLSGTGQTAGITLLCLVLMGVFRPERVSSWATFRLAWILLVATAIAPAFIFAVLAHMSDGSRNQNAVSFIPLIQPVLLALGMVLTLCSMKLRNISNA